MRFGSALALCASTLCLGVAAWGQTTFATITGNVTDSAGAVVINVAVTATHLETNYKYTAASNESGAYTLPQLREGRYSLLATAPGFQEFRASGIQLVSRDQRRIDIQLNVGSLQTSVDVTAGATLIETETARIGDTKTASAIKSLPLNTRSLYSFLALSPGVVAAGGGQATRRFAGSRINQSDQSIDGITVSNGFDGTQVSPLVSYVESYEEVRVDMANNSADIGSIGQVTIVSKSGTNELHGSAFDYYSTPWFRARNPFAAQRGTGIVHQPGFSVGGPVMIPRLYNGRNRTFFFGSFETSRGSTIQQLLNPSVPLPSWREGDFSRLLPGTVVRDPTTGTPFPDNRIPASRINPVSQRIQTLFYPLPNVGNTDVFSAQNYREQRPRAFDPNTYYTTRVDHRFSQNHFVFGRWTWNRAFSRAFESNLPTVGQLWNTRDTRALNLSYTWNLSPTLISESRWGYAFNNNPRRGAQNGAAISQQLGITGLVSGIPDLNGLLDVSFVGVGITQLMQTPYRDPGFQNFAQQIQQHVNWFAGKHSVKGGFMLNRVRFEDYNASDALFGRVSFSNRFTGHPYADFLLGIPTNANRAFPPALINRLRWSQEFFLADEWKVTPKLTVSLGVRYEWKPGWKDENGMQSIFDVETGRIVVPNGTLGKVSSLLPRGYVNVMEASEAGYPDQTLIETDRNNFAPRIGIAWRPLGSNTVIRSGYGIFYDVVPRAVSAGGSPFILNEPQFTNPANAPTVIFPQVFPSSGTTLASVGLPTAIRKDIRIPYSMQYNVTVEHQRWETGFRLSYIGTNTRQGEWGYDINAPVPDNRPYVDKPRRFPSYPGITYITNGAGHQYHSLSAETERRFSSGLQYQVSWTWARDISDLDRGVTPENPYDRLRERGVSLDIPTHRLSGNLIYQLPFGKGKPLFTNASRPLNLIVGGWETSWVYSYYSGQFLTPLITVPDPVGIAFTSSRTPPTVTIRPDVLRDPNLPSDQRSPGRWFDTGAFAAPALGRFGTSSRGLVKGPNSNVWHFGLSKLFAFTERVRLRAELTATNLLNHPNYANPNLNLSNVGAVGTISNVGVDSDLDQSGSRNFRAGVRLEW